MVRVYEADVPKINILKQKLGLRSQPAVIRYLLATAELELESP